jgi:adenylate cyclase
LLEQYVAPAVAERLIANQARPTLGGARQTVTVLMVDMRGSTEAMVKLGPEFTHSLMNDYLGLITDILFRFEGTIDRIEGDGIAALFGAPESHLDDPQRALYAAATMQREFARALARWRETYPLPASVGIGVGIATGEVIVGNIGSPKRLHYTTTGPAINLAARLAKGLAGTVQLDEWTWRTVGETLGLASRRPPKRPLHIRAKGFAELVPVYRLRPSELTRLPVRAAAATG